ncbi:MAG: glutamate--tRNA ligase, partial [Halofilum sp. (in: g-proteobacteria)]|nr:glutamate--tRNA ligase [Halofilum sp. (in: g-proteobacteria)]
MTAARLRTRFAPSPTGALHLGNARTALFNWLYARGQGGDFVIRSEDTDAERGAAGDLEALLSALAWLGLDWDEGPDRGGPHAPYAQSARRERHDACLRQLLEADRAYPCFCSREELAAARRRQQAAGQPPRYPGTCAKLDADQRAARRAEGRAESVRLRVPREDKLGFDDLVHGPQRALPSTLGDFVIARADGSPTFLFANAIDDADMGITHVLRGEDHLANTPRQLLLLRALGLPAPAYGHLPLVLGADGRPLSKRAGAASLTELQAAGYRPEAVVNHLARIGFAPESDALLAPAELAARFDLGHVGRAAARHDPQALAHWQRLAVEALDAADFLDWLQAHRPQAAIELPVSEAAFAAAVRPNVRLPADAWDWARRLFSADPAP